MQTITPFCCYFFLEFFLGFFLLGPAQKETLGSLVDFRVLEAPLGTLGTGGSLEGLLDLGGSVSYRRLIYH